MIAGRKSVKELSSKRNERMICSTADESAQFTILNVLASTDKLYDSTNVH